MVNGVQGQGSPRERQGPLRVPQVPIEAGERWDKWQVS
jgi:hypothetical protein